LENVEGLIQEWIEALTAIASAHSDEERVKADARSDELLTALLHAPVAEVRDFTRRLVVALEAEPRVPFIVRSAFKRLLEPIVLEW